MFTARHGQRNTTERNLSGSPVIWLNTIRAAQDEAAGEASATAGGTELLVACAEPAQLKSEAERQVREALHGGETIAGLRVACSLAESRLIGRRADPVSAELRELAAVARRAAVRYLLLEPCLFAHPADTPITPTATPALLLNIHARLTGWRHSAEEFAIPICAHLPGVSRHLPAAAAADLIDDINSPYVGWCLNLADLQRDEDVAAWIAELDHRITVLRYPGSPSVALADLSLMAHLARIGYEGPLVCSGKQ